MDPGETAECAITKTVCFAVSYRAEKVEPFKAPITTAADHKFCDIFPNFLSDDSHEISCLICYF